MIKGGEAHGGGSAFLPEHVDIPCADEGRRTGQASFGGVGPSPTGWPGLGWFLFLLFCFFFVANEKRREEAFY